MRTITHRRTKRKDIYVISTPKRPVPLEHHLYANRELYKIVDAKGEFLSSGCAGLADFRGSFSFRHAQH